jgi:hypothetical protein
MGCHQKLPKEQELLQMPGRGKLDFSPLLAALKDINYAGWTEIFMHPVPRGVAILDTIEAITAEINRSREYLTTCLASIATSSRSHRGASRTRDRSHSACDGLAGCVAGQPEVPKSNKEAMA